MIDPDHAKARMEASAVVATGALQIVFESVLHLKPWFMGGAAIAWSVYAVARLARDPALRLRWGLRLDNTGDALWQAFPILLGFTGTMAVYAHSQGTLILPRSVWILFLAYPIWGLAQQFLLQALVAANLRTLGWRRETILAACTVLFFLAHAPDWRLGAMAAAGGFVWTFMFLRVPNLWVLGIVHGWCGVFAFYWVLARDPLRDAPWAF